MRLTVISQCPGSDKDFICRDEKGNRRVVDLYTDTELPEGGKLLGKILEVDRLITYTEIAMGARVVGHWLDEPADAETV